MATVKPEWGAKRICPKCGAAFYDMKKKVVLCPKCGYKFSEDDLKGGLSTKIREKIAAKPEKIEEEDELLDDLDDENLPDDEDFLDENEDDSDEDAREVISLSDDEEN
jgi:hypothetical protein